MNTHRSRLTRFVTVAVVVTMPLLGLAGVAGAKTTKTAGAAKCVKHPSARKCQAAGGGTGTGGAPAQITVTVYPNPLVETGQSQIRAVVEVETLPAFAGDPVTLSSSQLDAACTEVQYATNRGTATPGFSGDTITVNLDNDGNATVALYAENCAPGSSVIEADLDVAPFITALTTLDALPPAVTPEGLTGFPNNEVETGDTTDIPSPSGDSDVTAVFYVETNPVYAEQNVHVSSPELESRCIAGWWFQGGNGGSVSSEPNGTIDPDSPVSQLDDDGNAVFVFFGASCAAGPSEVIADVMAGTNDTYTFTYTIDPPAPTI